MRFSIALLKELFFILLGLGLIVYADKFGKAFAASDIAFRKAMNVEIKDSEKYTFKVLKILIIIIGLALILSGALSFLRMVMGLLKR